MNKLNRRNVLAAGAAMLSAPGLLRAQGAPVKIGAIVPRQGVFAVHGEAATLAMKIALEQVGNKAMGRPIELITYDDPNPLGAQQNMRKLIQQDKVHAVLGGFNSATALAMASVGGEAKVPTVITSGVAKDITGKSCDPYVFRVNSLPSVYAKQLARELLPIGKRWYFLVGAFAYGQDTYQMMKAEVEGAGGKDVGMDATPVGTSDFSAIILKIRQAKPDVIVLGISGDDLVSFLKQYEEFGLRGRIPLASLTVADEDLWAQNNPTGIMGKFWHFNNPANSPAEKMLNDAVMKATGHPASQTAAITWVSTRMLVAGLDKAKSLEPAAIVRGIEAARIEGVRGYFRDWDHQFIWQPVVGQMRDKVTNKYDPMVIVSKPLNTTELERIYGTKEESACRMRLI